MRRARLLTFAAVSAEIANRVVCKLGGREEERLKARLVFERMFVAAMAWWEQEKGGRADIPGIGLARRARAANQPLTSGNFLKGQAVNGPYGVMARLARDLELVEVGGQLGQNGGSLLNAWSADEKLTGFADDEGRGDSAAWTKHVLNWMKDGSRPRSSSIWEQLADRLRPDKLGPRETRVLLKLLEAKPERRRMLDLLKAAFSAYQSADTRDRHAERMILTEKLRPMLGNDNLDRCIGVALDAIDVYENAAGRLQEVFDGIRWYLRSNGVATPERVRGGLAGSLEQTRKRIIQLLPNLDRTIQAMQQTQSLDHSALAEIREELRRGSESTQALAEMVLDRHKRVQHERKKGTWIDRDQDGKWVLLPGFGVDDEETPTYEGIFLHPFRVTNAYSLLADLGQVPGGNQ